MYKRFFIIISALLLITGKVHAAAYFRSLDITQQNTTAVSITATAAIHMGGAIYVHELGSPTKIKECSAIVFEPGVASSPCVVTGLSPGTTYAATVYSSSTETDPLTKFFSTNSQPTQEVQDLNQIAQNTTQQNTQTATAVASTASSSAAVVSGDQCHDGIDNDVDGKADQYGVDFLNPDTGKGDGVLDLEPDPSCFTSTATSETPDDVQSSIIPCTDKCTFSDSLKLLNNIISFIFKTLLIPVFILIVIYVGFKYITAQGNPAKVVNLKKVLGNVVVGIIILLCAWLIVRTLMTTLLNDNFKQDGIEFLGN